MAVQRIEPVCMEAQFSFFTFT